ncbi:MAG: 3-isopropylmalate dehydratase large subunit [Candidatus Omnitrophica bacterium]|nr:3-isopropylmalate dehydratase large subunit [Candidatus Omnitrophota bacterium]
MTITEKILLLHTKEKETYPGKFILADVDMALGNDITAPIAIAEFKKSGIKRVFNSKKIALIPDHFTPAKDLASALQAKVLSNFAREQNIKHYYEIGRMGVEHALLPELGLIKPGDIIIGADSHTCTYGAVGAFATGVGSTDLASVMAIGKVWLKVPESIKFIYRGKLNKWLTGKDIILYTIGDIEVDGALYKAMEFSGEAICALSMDERFSISNMAIEAGGKSGIIEPDEKTFEYIKMVTRNSKPETRKWQNLKSDKDAKYTEIREYDVSKWKEPAIACPHLPSNVKPVSLLKNVNISQVVIGSCTNGRISDLRVAAKLLRGKKVHSSVRLIVIPATQSIYLAAVKEGLAEIFVKAGGVFSTPTCGPCLGGHMGILDKGERCVATTNRNFKGRMGHPDSEVYLSNAAVAAASAIKGKITHPESI